MDKTIFHELPLYIDGSPVPPKSHNWTDVTNPATDKTLPRVPSTTKPELHWIAQTQVLAL